MGAGQDLVVGLKPLGAMERKPKNFDMLEFWPSTSERIELVVAPRHHHLELFASIAPPLPRNPAEESIETLQQLVTRRAETRLAPFSADRNDPDRL